MDTSHIFEEIAALIREGSGELDSIKVMVRGLIETRHENDLALIAGHLGKIEDAKERNSRLSILRMYIRRACTDLKLPMLTVKKVRGGKYLVMASDPTDRLGRYDHWSSLLNKISREAESLSLKERVSIMEQVLRALRLVG